MNQKYKKLYLFIICLWFLTGSFLNAKAPYQSNDYVLLSQSHQQVLYRYTKQPQTFLSLTTRLDERLEDFKTNFDDQQLDQLIKNRSLDMKKINVNDWQLKSSQITKNDSTTLIVKLTGSYEDHRQRKVDFLEIHHYSKKVSKQLLISAPQGGIVKHQASLEAFALHLLGEGK